MRYIEITPSLTLKDNFISRSHYMTEELLVHAGINHQLTLYLSYPDLPLSDYSMRNSNNRGIEAIHGIFRGGSSSLPMTSANLSFRGFLSQMNKTVQVHQAEHFLQHIDGSSFIVSKKKRLTAAVHSSEQASGETESYIKPATFKGLLRQLELTCSQRNEDSKTVISELAPQMATALNLKCELGFITSCLSS